MYYIKVLIFHFNGEKVEFSFLRILKNEIVSICEYNLKAIQQNKMSLRYTNEELRKDKEIVRKAI